MTVTASNYDLRPNDLYETEAWAVDALVRACPDIKGSIVYEPAAGNHAIVDALRKYGVSARTSDLETYDNQHDFEADFLTNQICMDWADSSEWIITNPPYGRGNRLAVRFIERALEAENAYVAMLLTAKFDFGKTRQHLFKNNGRFRAKINLLDRISWAGNGQTGTEDHAWYVWRPIRFAYDAPRTYWEPKQ